MDNISSRIASLSPKQRERLLERLKNEGVDITPYLITGDIYETLTVVESRDFYPLSSAQKRLFVLHQLDPGGTAYNMPSTFTFTGDPDWNRLNGAFQALIKRHDSLRTSFITRDGDFFQRVEPEVDFRIDYLEVAEDKVDKIVADFIRPFDLGKAPLLRVGLIKILGGDDKRHILLYDMHHIITDGISTAVLVKEFLSLYDGQVLPELPIQYKDYAVWQNKSLETDALKIQEEYWLDRFSGEIPVLDLSTDFPRPSLQSFEGDLLTFEAGEELTTQINNLVAETGATLFMVLLAGYNILLSKYTGQEDMVVGTPYSGRPHALLENIIGMFVNTLALRNYPAAGITFRAFLNEVRTTVLRAYDHQDYQFQTLMEKLNIKREMNRNPLFDTMFTLQDLKIPALFLSGLTFTPYELKSRIAKFDLTLYVTTGNENINIGFEYCTKLFKRDTILKMGDHFLNVLRQISLKPDIRLADIMILDEKEIRQILLDFNNTGAEHPDHLTINELFAVQVEKTPDQIAVVYQDQPLTYGLLNQKAESLAGILQSKGVTPEQIVGIMVDQTPEMLIGILGILKAGGAYLPLDCSHPAERIKYMLEDTKANLILSRRKYQSRYELAAEMLVIEDLLEEPEMGIRASVSLKPDHSAYVMYTSGSTGIPKGVMVTHRNIIRVVKKTNYINITEQDTLLQLSNYAFDGSTFDIFGALLNGAKLVLVERDVLLDFSRLGRTIQDQKVTIFFITTALFNSLVDLAPQCLQEVRKVLFGGEKVSSGHVRRAFEILGAGRIIHVYGPTESTVFATYHEVNDIEPEALTIPIGKPVGNTEVYIMNPWNQLQPVGVPGEIHIGGEGLGRGYLNQPELTAEKFVPDTFGVDSVVGANNYSPLRRNQRNPRLYRTGDLARWLPDGSIEFLGRNDYQVKIRGYRIELGEIESRLLKHEAVKETVVLAKKVENGSGYICAYLVADKQLTVKELRSFLEKELPDYMIPSHFIHLERMPLTANGKVDRKALPEPDEIITGVEYEAPRNEQETILAKIWEEVLGLSKPIGVNDNFFDLGGDSIKAIQVAARLQKHQMTVTLRDILKNSTIRELSHDVTLMRSEAEQETVEGEVALTPVAHWFFESFQTDIHYFNQVVMLYREIGFDEVIIRRVFQKIVEHHDALRMVFLRSSDLRSSELRVLSSESFVPSQESTNALGLNSEFKIQNSEFDQGFRIQNSEFRQYNRGLEGELFALKVMDLTGEEDVRERIKTETGEIQSSIDLSAGPLVKLGLFKTRAGDHLLITIHHLVVDEVSWRIILEDLAAGYGQAENNEAVKFHPKTDSYQKWAGYLQNYARSGELRQEIGYWRKMEENEVVRLPKVYPDLAGHLHDRHPLSLVLTEAETEKLLRQVNRAYHTETGDILLTALGLAVKEWTGGEKIPVSLEGDSREELIKAVDISRTVGRFTTIYPFVLDLTGSKDLAYTIKTVKEALRRLPGKGIGYGILRYLAGKEAPTGPEFSLKPEISFDFPGQFDQDLPSGFFKRSEFSPGQAMNPLAKRQYALVINGLIAGGRLTLNFDYNPDEYNETTISKIIGAYRNHLLNIINHCMTKEEEEYTPSDFGNHELTLEEFATILGKKKPVERIYPLSPMQEGMLYHHLLDRKSPAYFDQASFILEGELEIELFARSLGELIKRYDIFRTNFFHEGLRRPEQVVFKEREIALHYEDLSGFSGHEKEQRLERFRMADRERGFDLENDSLMRIGILQTDRDCYRIFWDFHHILMDGWCLGIVIREFFLLYEAFKNHTPLELEPAPPYSEYIDWLQKQDRAEAHSSLSIG